MQSKLKIATLSAIVALWCSAHSFAADIYTYQEQFNEITDVIQYGDVPKDSVEFDEIVESLKVLYSDLATDRSVHKKTQLLSDIKAVTLFMGEAAPDRRSYYLTIPEYYRAIQILNLQPERYVRNNSASVCLPIYRVNLWDNGYSAFFVVNNDSLMATYKIRFSGKTKHTTLNGSIDAAATKGCVRGIFNAFGEVKEVAFSQERCDREIQELTYIQPEIIQPKVNVYPDPDYLSKEEKQSLKQKQKKQLKKQKEKAKKKAQKAKKKKKKAMAKQRAEMRKKQVKERKNRMDEQRKQREQARKGK